MKIKTPFASDARLSGPAPSPFQHTPRTAAHANLAKGRRLRIGAGGGMLACWLIALAVPKMEGQILAQGSVDSINNPTSVVAPVSIENDNTGVTYSSLKFDSQLTDLLWKAYGVAELHNHDLLSFVQAANDGALFGYSISSGSQVRDGWFSSVNADGTIGLANLGGPSDAFSTGQTMTGNYFFNKGLLDADGDGNLNYTFHLLSDAHVMPNFSSPLTKTGVVGSNLNGNFLEAYAGIDTIPASGQAYALVPTDHHPAIPEPSTYALLLGASALAIAFGLKRRRYLLAQMEKR